MTRHLKFYISKIYKTIFVFVVFVLSTILFVKNVSTNRYSGHLLRSLKGPIQYDDPELLEYIRKEILEPPSSKPYHFFHHARVYKHPSEYFYGNYSQLLFRSKGNGFFVEAGAFDGQLMSNTLWLEKEKGWTGLLVEPDPSNYISLKSKNRKAWSAKACLSLDNYPKQEKLSSFDITSKNEGYADIKHRSMGSIVQESEDHYFIHKSLTNDETSNSYYIGQCLPLGSLLLALNVTKIDLLSLDVEFAEEEVIRNFDFDKFDVQVIYMEWWVHEKFKWLLEFMKSKNYGVVANRVSDIIFAKAGSIYERIAMEKNPDRKTIVFEPVKLQAH